MFPLCRNVPLHRHVAQSKRPTNMAHIRERLRLTGSKLSQTERPMQCNAMLSGHGVGAVCYSANLPIYHCSAVRDAPWRLDKIKEENDFEA